MPVELTANEIVGVSMDGCLFVCLVVHRISLRLVQGYNPTLTLRQLEFTAGNPVTLSARQAAVKDGYR